MEGEGRSCSPGSALAPGHGEGGQCGPGSCDQVRDRWEPSSAGFPSCEHLCSHQALEDSCPGPPSDRQMVGMRDRQEARIFPCVPGVERAKFLCPPHRADQCLRVNICASALSWEKCDWPAEGEGEGRMGLRRAQPPGAQGTAGAAPGGSVRTFSLLVGGAVLPAPRELPVSVPRPPRADPFLSRHRGHWPPPGALWNACGQAHGAAEAQVWGWV